MESGVRQHLIIANKALPSPGLDQLLTERAAKGPARFHIVVPRQRRATLVPDPLLSPNSGPGDELAVKESTDALAEASLSAFFRAYGRSAKQVTGEVSGRRPFAATRAAMKGSDYDEIILCTPSESSSLGRRFELQSRLRRAFSVPVATLIDG